MLYLLSVCLGLGYLVIVYIIKQAIGWAFWLCCCCSTAQLCLTLWDFMDCSMPVFLVLYHLLKFAQVHVHHIGVAIQPSHPLMPSYPYTLNLSQHQGLFQWVTCSHQMTKILEFQLQQQSFQWVFRVDFPYDWLVWSPCCPRDQILIIQSCQKSSDIFTFSEYVLRQVHDHYCALPKWLWVL